MSLRVRQGPPPGSGSRRMGGPPYPPREVGLGGIPDPMPDVPVTAVFLFLYIVFAITHIAILKRNKARGHKFIFNGALFGFCKIRIISMVLRISWAYYPRNVSLGIAAQVFVYAGTIILFITNWFFTQRVVRAQHPRFGWSAAYRVLHRVLLVGLIISLVLIIITSVWKSFTLDDNMLRIFRDIGNTGQTYFAAFCFAPVPLIFLSGLFPRRRTEKFGAGRLRNNITILVVAVLILSTGSIFRCVINWLPPTPARTSQGRPINPPWYYSKICFYVFNFTTEVLVVIFYAILRVDLRFYIPDGSKAPGDYSRKANDFYHNDESAREPMIYSTKNSRERSTSDSIKSEKNYKRQTMSLALGAHPNLSSETLYEYSQASLFEDTNTLADSLRYPSSTLEVDSKTGTWKVKRASQPGSIHSRYSSQYSPVTPVRNSHSRDEMPQVPDLPADWPLRDSHQSRSSAPVMEHLNAKGKAIRSSPLRNSDTSIDPISQAFAQLEGMTAQSTPLPPPRYETLTPTRPSAIGAPWTDSPIKKAYQPSRNSGVTTTSRRSSDIPPKHTYTPARKSTEHPKRHTHHAASSRSGTPASRSDSDLPRKLDYAAMASTSTPPQKTQQGAYMPVPTTPTTPTTPTPAPVQKRYYDNASGSTTPVALTPKSRVSQPLLAVQSPSAFTHARGGVSPLSSPSSSPSKERERFSFESIRPAGKPVVSVPVPGVHQNGKVGAEASPSVSPVREDGGMLSAIRNSNALLGNRNSKGSRISGVSSIYSRRTDEV